MLKDNFWSPVSSNKAATRKRTPPKTNIDTKFDGLEDVSPVKTWLFWVAMLDFRGVAIGLEMEFDHSLSNTNLRIQ